MVNQKYLILIKGCNLPVINNFISVLQDGNIAISMDGKGRALDNVFIERFWRSLKQEKIYKIDLISVKEAKDAISQYMEFYNNHRLHQSLGYETPRSVHFVQEKKKIEAIEIPVDMMDKSYDLPTYPQGQPLQQNYI